MLELKVCRNAFGLGLSGFVVTLLMALSLLSGCSPEPALSFSGMFVHSASSEFSLASDTLLISPLGEEQYTVERRTGIRMLDEQGQPGKQLLEREHWKAVYDANAEMLVEQSRGRRLRVVSSGILLESALYRRVGQVNGGADPD